MAQSSGDERPPHPGNPLGYTWEDKYPDVVLVLPHEPLGCYVLGGFHPVALGDIFCEGRYTVRQKLGHGGYSTVWLAEDIELKKWVSLKIKQVKVSLDQLEQDPEIKVLRLMEQRYNDRRYFARLLGYFHHTGPNGKHTCVVTELLGPTLSRVLRIYNDIDIQETLRPDTILRASRQLLEGISAAHEAGIVHGDISPRNIAFTCNSAWSNESLWDTLGGDPIVAPYEGKDPRPPGLPKQLVEEASWAVWYDSLEDGIRLIDWGETFPVDEIRSVVAQPVELRSPETFFIKSFDYRHDLWRAGCVIYSLFFQKSNFGFSMSDATYIKQLVSTFGSLPSNWHTQWQDLMKADPHSNPNEPIEKEQHIDKIFESRLHSVTLNNEQSEDNEEGNPLEKDFQTLKCLLNVMKGLMQHEPAKRLSVKEALSYIQWMDQWRD